MRKHRRRHRASQREIVASRQVRHYENCVTRGLKTRDLIAVELRTRDDLSAPTSKRGICFCFTGISDFSNQKRNQPAMVSQNDVSKPPSLEDARMRLDKLAAQGHFTLFRQHRLGQVDVHRIVLSSSHFPIDRLFSHPTIPSPAPT